MDKLKEYVKMSEEAKEIQESRIYLLRGDMFTLFSATNCSNGSTPMLTETSGEKRDLIWLPRQDQLFDMMRGGNTKDKLYYFHYWVINEIYGNDDAPTDIFHTLEQLYIVYIMQENYGKIWINNKWIIE